MQFKVPQFLEIEDKIFGPFTFKEFVYLAGGAGLCFVLFKLLGFWIGAIPILLVAGFSLTLTFYRPNNKPFIFMLESAFTFLLQSKLYIWKRRKTDAKKARDIQNVSQGVMERDAIESGVRLGRDRLKDLAWSLDVLDLKK